MNELAEACRDLRQIVDRMPAGPERERMEGDLSRLRARLSALPGRISARAVIKSAADVQSVLDEEFADAFCDVMRWFDPGVNDRGRAARASTHVRTSALIFTRTLFVPGDLFMMRIHTHTQRSIPSAKSVERVKACICWISDRAANKFL
jgi:hypothetical protein